MTQTQIYIVAALALGILIGRKSKPAGAAGANIADETPEWWTYAGSWAS